MNQDKMHLINKIFNSETIRTVWDKEQEKYFISVVDIVCRCSKRKNRRKGKAKRGCYRRSVARFTKTNGLCKKE